MTSNAENDVPETYTREDMARAFDEGVQATLAAGPRDDIWNPYRVLPPGTEANRDQ